MNNCAFVYVPKINMLYKLTILPASNQQDLGILIFVLVFKWLYIFVKPLRDVAGVKTCFWLECFFWRLIHLMISFPSRFNVFQVKFFYWVQGELRVTIVFKTTDSVQNVIFYKGAGVCTAHKQIRQGFPMPGEDVESAAALCSHAMRLVASNYIDVASIVIASKRSPTPIYHFTSVLDSHRVQVPFLNLITDLFSGCLRLWSWNYEHSISGNQNCSAEKQFSLNCIWSPWIRPQNFPALLIKLRRRIPAINSKQKASKKLVNIIIAFYRWNVLLNLR